MRYALLLMSILITTGLAAQVNMSLIGQLNYQALHGSDISDVWGYVDEDGNEYALVGVNNGGVSVVSLADPSDPVEVFYHPGPGSVWRDLKVWNDHAYITTEGGGGLVIVDLSPLPQSNNLNAISFFGANWVSAHNLYIDENGICYIFGSDRGNGGVIFYDLNVDPMAPAEVGQFDQWYVHDGMARGDTLYLANIYQGFFSIVDVSDKTAPALLGTRTTGNNFTHNIWVSDDGDYVYTTDEVTGGFIGSYDISDPSDIQELDQTQSDPGSGTIPHNTHFINGFVVTSYYRYGITIHDVAHPYNVVEVGHYDTSPLSGSGFNGSWGAYPYLPSGLILATDIENGLFVFDAQYVSACWLEGTVTDALTSAALNNAQVEILMADVQDSSSFDGTYATGYHTAGSYDVQVSKPGYFTQVVQGVALQNGVTTVLDVQLQPLQSFTLGGEVNEQASTNGVPFATVNLVSNDYNYTIQTLADGTFILSGVYPDTYNVYAGAWGWNTICLTGMIIDPNTAPLVLELPVGYYDDFALDLGWTEAATATSGIWERGKPDGTLFGNGFSNPNSDVTGDCSNQAYITGNGGGSAGNDDVDDGTVTLYSPIMDLSTFGDPSLRFARWFFNSGGQGNPNDEMLIKLTDGTDTVIALTIQQATPGMGSWVLDTLRILDHLTLSNTMQFIVEVSDISPGHLVEGGLDIFEVVDSLTTTINSQADAIRPAIYPVPTTGVLTVRTELPFTGLLQIMDASGRIIGTQRVNNASQWQVMIQVAGMHLLQFIGDDGTVISRPVVVTP